MFTVARRSSKRPYAGQPFAQGVQEILGGHVTVQVAKRSELHTFKVMPKRWIVERNFAWLDKNRRLWKNCERWLRARGYFVSTVGRDEQAIRQYIREQEKEDERLEQMGLWK